MREKSLLDICFGMGIVGSVCCIFWSVRRRYVYYICFGCWYVVVVCFSGCSVGVYGVSILWASGSVLVVCWCSSMFKYVGVVVVCFYVFRYEDLYGGMVHEREV